MFHIFHNWIYSNPTSRVFIDSTGEEHNITRLSDRICNKCLRHEHLDSARNGVENWLQVR